MEKLLDEYQERFGECFPLMLCRTMTDDEISEIIEDCLKRGEPYTPELNIEADY